MTHRPQDDTGLVAHGIDTTRPSVARVYDFFLGGKDNYASDRALSEQIMEVAPEAPIWARTNRRWLGDVVTWLAGECGIERFIDAGSGLPTAENTHEVAQKVNAGASVVYIDNDPSVVAHGRALLVDNERTQFTAADLTDPEAVLADPAVAKLLAAGEPVALVMGLMLHHIGDFEETRAVVRRYVDALPAGSYLAVTHACNPGDGGPVAQVADALMEKVKTTFPTLRFRTPAEITALFGDLELLPPGLVPVVDWHPPSALSPDHDEEFEADVRHLIYAAVARKD
ncbi:SAM-dependent methyltransferase [Kribbella sp. NPDC026611]|uniref:SAM-dependent methyltransferase n=1 Tax=Kribbella sp. NPDC026611 TaxID=3154911 RepID=UPI003408A2B4